MGGRGTFAAGKQVAYTYETVGKVDGVKIIKPIDKSKSLKLPEESHSSVGYVLYDKDGFFHQYREYNSNHEVVLEIGYHHEKVSAMVTFCMFMFTIHPESNITDKQINS